MLQVLSSLRELDSSTKFALTIGNFDGVHLGHQFLLSKLKTYCVANAIKLAVMTFRPHPQEILGTGGPFQYLSTYDEKVSLLKNCGVDFIIEIPFNRDLSTISAVDYIEHYILVHQGLRKLTLGHDFAFGSRKEGNLSFMKNYWTANQIKTKQISLEIEEKFLVKGNLVSSSVIRKLINEGDVKTANQYLGKEYMLEGLVVKGDGRGKTIGFPTANMNYSAQKCLPSRGVYSTTAIHQEKLYPSLTNIGLNPTFLDQNILRVETHILSFSKDIYGENIKVQFLDRIRDEKKFTGPKELIEQITRDINYRQAH